ncbi:Gfo/Idh/MocA family protein [Cohnella cholangitidis]|uniref:Gfo/Idh/MocA family oxidoreductase n=1 Tax=Cohnella cholangitidis TaxID=2598458 RepID=A0A7G5BXL5_9BACL|nr:Gfo/Idh/MocA family oxidoreductase [Cohnella cholangitidis]QMV41699.1 Gfo/Idh/MocA family oxidoreductase [Cohnella cholangitidis]
MNVLIIGYGSIGERHAELFEKLGCKVGVVSSRDPIEKYQYFRTTKSAMMKSDWDWVVISNRTVEHYLTLNELIRLNYTGSILVEKPIFESPKEFAHLPLEKIFVSYNLRFHPCIQKLRYLLQGETLLSAQFYVGQYLPGWRPGQDYRQTYSASKAMGGGVLRDLSHELDLVLWLLGKWNWVTAIGGTYSQLELDSDDVFALLVQTEHCPVVNVQLNYIDRIAQRKIIINTERHTFAIDLINSTISVDGTEERMETTRNTTYVAQHERIVNGEYEQICTFREGIEVMRLIDAAETSASQKVWMKNEAMHNMR